MGKVFSNGRPQTSMSLLTFLLAASALGLGACSSNAASSISAPPHLTAPNTLDEAPPNPRPTAPANPRPTELPPEPPTEPFIPQSALLQLSGHATVECDGVLRVGAPVGGRPTLRCHLDVTSADAGQNLLWTTPLGRNGNLFINLGGQLLVDCLGKLAVAEAPTVGRWGVECTLAQSPGVEGLVSASPTSAVGQATPTVSTLTESVPEDGGQPTAPPPS